MRNVFILAASFMLLFICCNSDDEMEIKPFDSYESGAYVINRGTPGIETGSISYYVSNCLQGINGIFERANGYTFPDEIRDMCFTDDGRALILTPTQIIIVTQGDFLQTGSIPGFDNAQQIELISPAVAYVTQYSAGHGLKVVDLNAGAVVKSLLPGKACKAMVRQGLALYAANSGGIFVDSTLSKIDAVNHELLSYIEVGKRPIGLEIDAVGNLWVLSEGVINNLVNPEAPENVLGSLMKLSNDQVVTTIDLGAGARNLAIDKEGQTLFYVDRNWTYELPITAVQAPLIPFATNSFNGYDVDPVSGLLYGCNAGDFQGNGEIWVYDVNTQDTLSTFQVGNAPLEVVFR